MGLRITSTGKEDFPFDLPLDDDENMMIEDEDGSLQHLSIGRGPLKRRERAIEKINNDYNTPDYQEPRGQYLVDLIRAQLTFEDPYVLAAFFEYVKKNMKVIRVKNKFAV